jgi:hypothetical protein
VKPKAKIGESKFALHEFIFYIKIKEQSSPTGIITYKVDLENI